MNNSKAAPRKIERKALKYDIICLLKLLSEGRKEKDLFLNKGLLVERIRIRYSI
jgi:hypothetical protein